MADKILRKLQEVNKELWLLLTMFVILAMVNCLVVSGHVLLGLYTLPVIFSAYYYGRRHATLTAVGAMCLVILVTRYNPALFSRSQDIPIAGEKWFEISAWGGTLMLTAYAMGTLYERMRVGMEELRQTYFGVLMILRHFISKDKYTENHSYRVSVYATKIAAYLGLKPQQIDDIRSAALLHDIGKLDVSRELLHKAGRLTSEEYSNVQRHVDKGVSLLEPISGSLRRVIPIILAHHDKFDGSGYHPTQAEDIPIEARVISVADVYDALTSDRPYRKGMAPFEARDIIAKGAGTDFDPQVVNAFVNAFSRRELELSEVQVA
ncbi:MAG TPA: HD-GYP domain-containing protein [Terriglobia bacterium]|nr:HD-GYP domain-containing protein [Terriglobia bacterium]